MLALALVACCSGCSRPENAESETLRPEVHAADFYEGAVTLAAARKSGEPLPLVVLLVRDPWAQVIGSDSPKFALYEDGTVIQRAGAGFTLARLSKAETKRLLDKLNPRALERHYGSFRADDATDQPEQSLRVYQGEKPIFISVYGSLERPEVRSRLPKDLTAAYDMLGAFSHPQSQPWLPDKIEVMVWPFESAASPPLAWPAGWPDLSDPTTVRRADDLFSIYMPSSRFAELRALLLARGKENRPISLDGRKWAASIRFPFPQEGLWMAPSEEAER